MISQKCPKCLSNRVRRGYRPTPFWSKILFRYNLLCDNCNWEFTGFAVPGTVTSKPTKRTKTPIMKKDDGFSSKDTEVMIFKINPNTVETATPLTNAAPQQVGKPKQAKKKD